MENTNPKQNKIKRITVRVTDDNYTILKENAEKTGHCVASYIRLCALRHQPKSRLNSEQLNLYREISKMSVNLNTLAKNSHSQNMFAMMNEIIEMRNAISEILKEFK